MIFVNFASHLDVNIVVLNKWDIILSCMKSNMVPLHLRGAQRCIGIYDGADSDRYPRRGRTAAVASGTLAPLMRSRDPIY